MAWVFKVDECSWITVECDSNLASISLFLSATSLKAPSTFLLVKLFFISSKGISEAVVTENTSHFPVMGFFFLIILMNILLS